MIVVEIPGRGSVTWDGPDSLLVAPDIDAEVALLDLGDRGYRKLDEIQTALEADARRVLGQPAYRRDAFDGDGDFRLIPGTAEHARVALLSLDPAAEIVDDDEELIEATLRRIDRM